MTQIFEIYKVLLFIVLFPINLLHHFIGFRVVKLNYRRIGHLISEYDSILLTYGLNNKYIYFAIPEDSCANKYFLKIISMSHVLFSKRIIVHLIQSMTRWGSFSVCDSSKFILAERNSALYPKLLNEVNFSIFKKQIAEDLKAERHELLTNIFGSVPDWYVCIHIRSNDDEYLDREMQKYRNSSLINLRKAVNFIKSKNGRVLLMGPKKRMKRDFEDGYFDYASSALKSDFNDIVLISGCKFFLGCTSGLFMVATFFGIPCGLSNIVPLTVSPFSKNDFYIYKHHFDTVNKKYLNFDQVKNIGLESERVQWHLQTKIQLVENSEEEIESLCKILYDQEILGNKIHHAIHGYAKLDSSYYGFHSLSRVDPSFVL